MNIWQKGLKSEILLSKTSMNQLKFASKIAFYFYKEKINECYLRSYFTGQCWNKIMMIICYQSWRIYMRLSRMTSFWNFLRSCTYNSTSPLERFLFLCCTIFPVPFISTDICMSHLSNFWFYEVNVEFWVLELQLWWRRWRRYSFHSSSKHTSIDKMI